MNTSDARPRPRSGAREKVNGGSTSEAGRRAGGTPAGSGAPDQSAGFSALAPAATGVPAWPIHPVLWLEPDLRTALPATSGLRVERSHGIPAAGFIAEQRYFDRPPVAACAGRPARPQLPPAVPSSGLRPLERESRSPLGAGRPKPVTPAPHVETKDK